MVHLTFNLPRFLLKPSNWFVPLREAGTPSSRGMNRGWLCWVRLTEDEGFQTVRRKVYVHAALLSDG